MRSIILKAKKQVFSSQLGLFSSTFGKEGYDFFDLEPYDYTSDAKRIDWKTFAKTRELYKKNFSEERSKNIHLIPILSATLFFGSSRLKIETLIEALAIVGFSAIRAKERLFIEGVAVKNVFEFEAYLEKIARTNLIGQKATFDQKLFYRSPKALTIVLSDFLEPIDLSLFSTRDDVVAIMVVDRLERDRVFHEEAVVVDTLTLQKKSTTLANSMKSYHKKIRKIHETQKVHFEKQGIEWIELFGESDVFSKLFYFFRSR